MDKHMLVEIYVSFANEQGNVATGYPVAPSKILTARHALYSKQGAEPQKIKVRWHYLKGEDDSYNWRSATVVECGLDEALDVALLECDFPENIKYQCYLEPANPKKEFGWESAGFARAGKRDDERPPTPLSGETYSAADNDPWLVLTEKGKVTEENMWAGISGAPVFVKERNTIAGVVVKCPPNYDATRLHAAPTWKLLACTGFREAIDYDVRAEHRNNVSREVQRTLLQTKDVFTALREGMEGCYHVAWEYQSETDVAEAMAEFIIDMPMVRLLELFDSAITGFLALGKNSAAQQTRQLLYTLLPVAFDQRVIKSFNGDMLSGVWPVPFATTTVAEIVMAGVDGRAVEYVSQDDLHEELCGKNNIESQIKETPNLGVCADTDQLEVISDHLIDAYCGIKDKVKRTRTSRDRLIDRTEGEMKRLSKYLSTTLYCVYELPEKASDREESAKLWQALKDRFQPLVLMDASTLGANEDEEYETYFLLRKIHTTVIEVE